MALFVAVYSQYKTNDKLTNIISQKENQYQQCLIDSGREKDSLRVYYTNKTEQDLRDKIAEYDNAIRKANQVIDKQERK